MSCLRSFLFIPGDSERMLGHGDASGADALILDLEDAVVSGRKPVARDLVAAFLRERPRVDRNSQLWVRINALDTDDALPDLGAIVPTAPNGIMLPKAHGPEDVRRLSHYLDALEASAGVAAGSIRILPVATETAAAPFRLGDYATAKLDRLFGLTWGAEDLSSAIGASTNVDVTGGWALTYRLVRSLTLLGAHAAGVEAIDTLYIDFRDNEGLRASCRAARAEGFTGRIAVHLAQVSIINEAFSPTDKEADLARRVIAAFAVQPDTGAIGLEGRLFDLPHLNQAKRTLAAFERRRN